MEDTPRSEGGPQRRVDGRWVIAILAIAVATIAAYFAVGMPGMDHGADRGAASAMDASEVAVGVDEFARRMASPEAFVVNVHVPDEGTIDGTDAAIPYRDILDDARLPAATSTSILLYCKTGRMSAEAATALLAADFTDVVHLEGGMDAWAAAGRPLR